MTKRISISLLAMLAAGTLYAGHGTHNHHKHAHKWHHTAHNTAHGYHKRAHSTARRYHQTAHNAAMGFLNGSENAYASHKYPRKHGVRVHVGGWHGEAGFGGSNGPSAGAGHDNSGDHSIGVDTSAGGVSFGF